MTDTADIALKFWKALKSDRTAMLWVEGTPGSRPMTVQVDPDTEEGPLWIFTSNETELVQSLAGPKKAVRQCRRGNIHFERPDHYRPALESVRRRLVRRRQGRSEADAPAFRRDRREGLDRWFKPSGRR